MTTSCRSFLLCGAIAALSSVVAPSAQAQGVDFDLGPPDLNPLQYENRRPQVEATKLWLSKEEGDRQLRGTLNQLKLTNASLWQAYFERQVEPEGLLSHWRTDDFFGYFQVREGYAGRGAIYYSQQSPVQGGTYIYGAFWTYFDLHGREAGELGYPLEHEGDAAGECAAQGGVRQQSFDRVRRVQVGPGQNILKWPTLCWAPDRGVWVLWLEPDEIR